MATSRTWLGGHHGNNNAGNPDNWSPTGAPQPGDTLSVIGSLDQPVTMNVYRNDLAGDQVYTWNADLTVNMSHKAVMTADLVENSTATFNLSQHSTLNLSLLSGFHVGIDSATVNMVGNNNLHFDESSSRVTINLSPGSTWNGSFTTGGFFGPSIGNISVNGGVRSAFNNNATSLIVNNEQATLDTNVIGNGNFDVVNSGFGYVGARLEFAGYVGPHQSVSNSGLVILDKPNHFAGSLTLTSNTTPDDYTLPSPAEIDLMGLAKADSYTFKNDMLSIFSGDRVIDRLHLHDSTQHGFVVEPPSAGGSVNIVAITDPMHPPAALPIHTWCREF